MKDFQNFTFSDFTEHSVAPQYDVVGKRFVVTYKHN